MIIRPEDDDSLASSKSLPANFVRLSKKEIHTNFLLVFVVRLFFR